MSKSDCKRNTAKQFHSRFTHDIWCIANIDEWKLKMGRKRCCSRLILRFFFVCFCFVFVFFFWLVATRTKFPKPSGLRYPFQKFHWNFFFDFSTFRKNNIFCREKNRTKDFFPFIELTSSTRNYLPFIEGIRRALQPSNVAYNLVPSIKQCSYEAARHRRRLGTFIFRRRVSHWAPACIGGLLLEVIMCEATVTAISVAWEANECLDNDKWSHRWGIWLHK